MPADAPFLHTTTGQWTVLVVGVLAVTMWAIGTSSGPGPLAWGGAHSRGGSRSGRGGRRQGSGRGGGSSSKKRWLAEQRHDAQETADLDFELEPELAGPSTRLRDLQEAGPLSALLASNEDVLDALLDPVSAENETVTPARVRPQAARPGQRRAAPEPPSHSHEADADVHNVDALLSPESQGSTLSPMKGHVLLSLSVNPTSESDVAEDGETIPQRGYTFATEDADTLNDLLGDLASEHARRDAVTHRSITCNHCGMSPIRGVRFKCGNCADFDICEVCEHVQPHNRHHLFIKIRVPIPPLANPRSILVPSLYPGALALLCYICAGVFASILICLINVHTQARWMHHTRPWT
jgi:hypothetical protein